MHFKQCRSDHGVHQQIQNIEKENDMGLVTRFSIPTQASLYNACQGLICRHDMVQLLLQN